MQGDIFQLESLTSQVAVPKPAMARARPTSDPQVAIYNEDDLSHLLYVSNNPNHHHHHHHRHHNHEQRPYTHPADVGTILINTVMDDMEANTPALSDCDSCCGSETSDGYVESPVTPPLSTLDDIDDEALEAYRRKGRRNAFSTDLQDGFGFPIFLGRQDEEESGVEEWPLKSRNPPQEQQQQQHSTAVKTAEIPASQHVSAIEGSMMAWWPEPLDTMEADWTVEKTQWQLQLEKEKLREREREGGIKSAPKKSYEGQYGAAPVGDIDGRLMSWWPTPLYDWSERFYE
ncbi:hypothetical protein F5Y09DRAFT_298343 [Xylaria sp. FL1042]|nr:hypothetical protein F5Y09DRAFT_298343 [Xylaria sp. FL1042]